jgi:DNA-binding transcriptional LysR family regulator
VNLVLLPSPCSFRKIATEGLEKANRNWEIVFTGTSIANIQAAVQAGMGLSILPMGAIKEGLRKAPIHLGLPELPMYSIVLITNASKGMTQCT